MQATLDITRSPCLVAEIAYPVLEDYKQSLWSVYTICPLRGRGNASHGRDTGSQQHPPQRIFLRGPVQRDPGASRGEQSSFGFESLMFTPDLIGSLRKSGDQRDGGEKVFLAGRIYNPLRSILCFSYKSL